MSNNIQKFNWQLGGVRGHRIIDNGFSATAGESFFALYVIADAVIDYTNTSGGDDAVSLALTAGLFVYGVFPAADVSVASGTVIGYIA